MSRIARVLATAALLSCRRQPSAPPNESPSPTASSAERPAAIAIGSGVVVRPGGTLWLDAAGTRPIVLPDRMPEGGLALTVLADHGARLEVETTTSTACADPFIGDFALRLFVARSDLRAVTTSAVQQAYGEEHQLRVAKGVPVDGRTGARWVAVSPRDEAIRVAVAETQIGDHAPPPLENRPCAELLTPEQSVGIDVGDPELAALRDDGASAYSGPITTVRGGAKVWWRDGLAAGTVARNHTFLADAVVAGARACLPLRLAAVEPTMHCFEAADLRRGTAIDGSAALGNADIFGARASEGPIPRVSLETPTVKGAIDGDIVRRIFRAHINEIRHCYNQALARNPETAGRVVVELEIGVAGTVEKAEAASTSFADDDLGTCIRATVRRWRFPKPDDGRIIHVSVPLVLHTGE